MMKDSKKMVFMGQGSIGKREYEFWKGIIGYEVIAGEGKCFRTTWKNVRELLDQDIPVILFGLDMFYLPYQGKFYHKQHIPGHVVLMTGYDEADAYVHDNSKTEVQTIPIAELELAWAEDYIGISRKNAYFGIDMKNPETDIARLVQKGITEENKLEKQKKCYIYTRVSTAVQVDGYSLDAQRDKLEVSSLLAVIFCSCINQQRQSHNKSQCKRDKT